MSTLVDALAACPLFAFGISLSELLIGDLGLFFWALVGGTVVSLALEREAWAELRPSSEQGET